MFKLSLILFASLIPFLFAVKNESLAEKLFNGDKNAKIIQKGTVTEACSSPSHACATAGCYCTWSGVAVSHCIDPAILNSDVASCLATGCSPVGFDDFCGITGSFCKTVVEGEYCDDCGTKAIARAMEACPPPSDLSPPEEDVPVVDQPSSDEPTNNPSTNNPSTNNPSTNNPSTNDPSTNNPSTNNPPVNNPSSNNPSTNNPSSNDDRLLDSTSSACFPAHGQVRVRNGQTKRIDEVQIGDEVQVGHGKFSRVFGFTHREGHGLYSFLQLTMSNGNKLQVSEGHYLYANDNLVIARSVKIGDHLKDHVGRYFSVDSIERRNYRGLFNPQTIQGDIIVNNFLVSTYTEFASPKVAHSLLSPIRAMFRSVGVCVLDIEKF